MAARSLKYIDILPSPAFFFLPFFLPFLLPFYSVYFFYLYLFFLHSVYIFSIYSYSCVIVFMPVAMSTSVNSSSTVPNTTTTPVSNVHKRVKVTLACTVCRKKKVKCDGIHPSCSRCNTLGFSCQYSDPPKKRGPPKGQVEIISSRAHRIKSLRTGQCHKTYSGNNSRKIERLSD